MSTVKPDRGPAARLVELVVADQPEAWEGAGFTVDDGLTWLGPTRIRLVGRDGGARGILGWTVSGLAEDPGDGYLDGLATTFVDGEYGASWRPQESIDLDRAAGAKDEPGQPVEHRNGIVGLDHVVVATPDLDRTIAAFEDQGVSCRRIRDTTSHGSPMRQAFFKFGPVVIEVVSGDLGDRPRPTPADGSTPADDPAGPARWFGLAADVADLDRTAAELADGLGSIRAAVQRGRRIATLRHRTFDLSVPVAVMDDHGDRVTPTDDPTDGPTDDPAQAAGA